MVTIEGKQLKLLIGAVTMTANAGSIGGTDVVSLQMLPGKLRASMSNVILSRASVPASGELEQAIGLDEKPLSLFASQCQDGDQVELAVTNTVALLQAGKRELELPTREPNLFKLQVPEGSPKLTLTKLQAQQLQHLVNVAFDGSSRPELSCVFLHNGQAMACSQKVITVLSTDKEAKGAVQDVAVAVGAARLSEEGVVVYAGQAETIVRRGIGYYGVPSPVEAQKSFPWEAILNMTVASRRDVAKCYGGKFAQAVKDCMILEALVKTEAILQITATKGQLELEVKNGGARFKTSIPATVMATGECFKIPLTELSYVAQFIEGKVMIGLGQSGETIISFDTGTSCFPAWSGK